MEKSAENSLLFLFFCSQKTPIFFCFLQKIKIQKNGNHSNLSKPNLGIYLFYLSSNVLLQECQWFGKNLLPEFFCTTNKNSISFHFCTHSLLLPAYLTTTYLVKSQKTPLDFDPAQARIRLASFEKMIFTRCTEAKTNRTDATTLLFACQRDWSWNVLLHSCTLWQK